MGNEVLNPREKQILSLIVSEYITSGKPVSSRSLSRHKSIDLSPATIRNVMADLEEKGYIYQPHVSAGRIPSDAGYRFYVDNMMHLQELTLRENRGSETNIKKRSLSLIIFSGTLPFSFPRFLIRSGWPWSLTLKRISLPALLLSRSPLTGFWRSLSHVRE